MKYKMSDKALDRLWKDMERMFKDIDKEDAARKQAAAKNSHQRRRHTDMPRRLH